MKGLPDIALAIAAVIGAVVALFLAYVAGRRVLSTLLVARMDRRVRRVQAVLAKHQQEQFASMDRLLFQLGELHDVPAVESTLGQMLKSGGATTGPWTEKIYESLGLIEVYIRRLKEAPAWSDRAEAAAALGQLKVARAIPDLVAVMRDRHEDTRTVKLAAAQALARMEAAEAVPLLVAELASVDEWASPRIAEVLAGFGTAAVPALIETLGAKQSINARVWAAQILGRLGATAAEPHLVALLRDRYEQVRVSAAEALGQMRSRQAVNELIRVAMKDPVAPVRAEAARALGAIGDEVAVEGLVSLLSDPDYWSRLRAIEAIELIAPTDPSSLEAALRDPSPELRRRAAVALDRVGVISRKVEELASSNEEIRDSAHRVLVEIGRAGLVESFFGLVEHADFRVRSRMADVLGDIGDPRSIAALAPLTRDPVWPVRAHAVQALARLGSPEAVKLILAALSDEEETVRAVAAAAVRSAEIHDQEGVFETLARLLDTDNAGIRASVVEAVGHLDHEAVSGMLERALADPNAEVRLRGVQAVTARPDSRWVEGLVACLGDPTVSVRVAAAEGLGRLATAPALAALVSSLTTPDREFREALTTLLAKRGVEAVKELASLPQTRDSILALVWTLGKTGDPRAVAELQRLREQGDAEVRAAVAGALGKIEHPDAERVLRDMLDDRGERVRAAAVNALGRLRSSEAVPRLLPLLKDPDPFVRNRVALSLGHIGGSEVLAGLDQAQLRDRDPEFLAHVVLGYGLCGGEEGFKKAIQQLGDPAMQERVQGLLAREPEEIRQLFHRNLRLSESKDKRSLSSATLVEQYATTLRTHQDATARITAIEALQSLGADSYRDILLDTVATDPAPEVRRLALSVLSTDPRAASSALEKALRDPAIEVQLEAALGLGRTRDPKHNRPLLTCFTVGEPELDRVAIRSLAANNRDHVLSFIDELMGYSETRIFRGGAAVLGDLGDPRATGMLRAWLASGDPGLRAVCARSLGAIGALEAKEALMGTLGDIAEEVRLASTEALARMPGADTVRALHVLTRDPSLSVRLCLARLLGTLRQVGVTDLVEVLSQDPDENVRFEALLSSLLLRDVGAMERFTELVANQPGPVQQKLRALPASHPVVDLLSEVARSDTRPSARVVSLKVLTVLGQHPVDLLLHAFNDPSVEVRVAAVEAAASVKEQSTVQQALERLLRDPDKRVRDTVRKLRVFVLGG
jgi:HEAT repeat protein